MIVSDPSGFVSEAQQQAFSAIKTLPSGSVSIDSLAAALKSLKDDGLIDATHKGRTLLGLACGLGLSSWVKGLLALGASASAQDAEGDAPLHLLARYHHTSLASQLLRAGADHSAQNKDGQTPMDLAVGRHAVVLLDAIVRHTGSATALPSDFDRFQDPSISGFLRYLSWRAAKLGVEFRFIDAPSVPYNGNPDTPVSGFFVESPAPVLGLAIGKDPEEWLEILAHESSHMDQWAQGSQAWSNNVMPDGREAVDWIDDWISGQEVDQGLLSHAFQAAKAVELDCERRTITKIRSFGLPIDVRGYAQRANAYVHFYGQVEKTRAWNETGRAPYQIKEVWSRAPEEMVDEPTPELSAAYETFWPSDRSTPRRLRP